MNQRHALEIIERIDAIEADLRGLEVRLTGLRYRLAEEWRVDPTPPRPIVASESEDRRREQRRLATMHPSKQL